jgi:hypothetical protein
MRKPASPGGLLWRPTHRRVASTHRELFPRPPGLQPQSGPFGLGHLSGRWSLARGHKQQHNKCGERSHGDLLAAGNQQLINPYRARVTRLCTGGWTTSAVPACWSENAQNGGGPRSMCHLNYWFVTGARGILVLGMLGPGPVFRPRSFEQCTSPTKSPSHGPIRSPTDRIRPPASAYRCRAAARITSSRSATEG